jgi:hypothetical protein
VEITLVRQNYNYQKHQKEVAKQKKREEKRQRKLDRKGHGAEAHGDQTGRQPDPQKSAGESP